MTKTLCRGYSFEMPPAGDFNEYPQHMFSWRAVFKEFLSFTTVWANSEGYKLIVFFSQKTAFDITCKLFPMGTIYMKCQNLFSGKNKKKYFKMSSAENFTHNAKGLEVFPIILSSMGTNIEYQPYVLQHVENIIYEPCHYKQEGHDGPVTLT